VGGGTHSNIELAMAVDPDVYFTFYSAYPEFNLHPKLWEAGVTAFPMADHMETTPLGRAEWVKLLALLVNKEAQANEWFAGVEAEYEALKASTSNVADRPRVLYGSPDTRDSWQLRGDRNYFATLVRDAGGEYFWERGGASSLERGPYEEVLHDSASTAVWISASGLFGVDNIEQLIAKDARNAWLHPVKMRRVHSLDRGAAGAWTSPWGDQSLDQPHRALADLIRVIHPEIALAHEELFIRHLD
jgi:iron complex transport system substrate-binding protein